MTWRLDEAGLRTWGDHAALTPDEGLAGGPIPYRIFAGRAVAVAEQLLSAGIGPGEPVAILSSGRGADEPIALAATLLTGAFAVPLDASAPAGRWRDLIDGAGCRAIVHDEAATEALRPVAGLAKIELDAEGFVLASLGDAAERHQPPRPELACLLHTSGSTGRPKPIGIRWTAIDAFTAWMGELTALAPGRRVLRVAELGFDLALFDHLASWRFGATLGLVGRRALGSAKSLAAAVASARPHVIYAVPAFFSMLARGSNAPAPAELDRICFAGERFPPRALVELHQWAPEAKLFNLYGPTETNVCTFHEASPGEIDGERHLPIGRPCPYADCRLVDAAGKVIEGPGEGELVVRGVTALDGEVHTRDRVARDAEGLFHFVGRMDRMVKIGGRRVEPAEVESELLRLSGVQEAAVIAEDHPRLGRRLLAFVAPQDLDAVSLRRALAARLPPYMVPDRLRALAALPRNHHGKIDFGALSS